MKLNEMYVWELKVNKYFGNEIKVMPRERN